MKIRRIAAVMLVLLVISVGMLWLVLALLLSDAAIVASSPAFETESINRAKLLLKDLNRKMESSRSVAEIRAERRDLEAIASLLHRTFPSVQARANPSRLQLLVAVSARLPANPFGRYLNLRLNILPSSTGLELSRIEIGRLGISGGGALFLGERIANLLLGDAMGSKLRDSISAMDMDETGVTVIFRPLPGIKASLRQFGQQLAEAGEELQPFVDPARVRVYYQILCRHGELLTGLANVSADQFTRPVFRAAHLRSGDARAALEENKAALAALGIYLGNTRFQAFFGRVHDAACPLMNPGVTLAARRDLTLHFVYSAVIRLLSDSGVSFSIGEYKELLDASSGGSGISFSDLAADMAGIRLAESLLDPATAWSTQSRLAQDVEADFFPAIVGLPDNLGQAAFERDFGGPNDARYRAVLREIDNRINELPLYRSLSG